jgi:PEGA domain
MKTPAILVFVLAAACLWGQTPAPAPAACAKNVSLAVAEGGQPVPAIPKFALKWLSNESHLQKYPNLCFSQIPSSNTSNYVVVFSTAEAMFQGLTPSAHTYTSMTPVTGNTTPISSYGGTWSYAYVGVPPVKTTTTMDLKRDDKAKTLYARAYNQQGGIVSRRELGGGWFPSREKVLENVLSDIAGNAQLPVKQKPIPAPLSVYYVNCNVDEPLAHTAMQSPPGSTPSVSAREEPPAAAPPPPPPPPPETQLEIWSSPAGADIFVDGSYVGKTPHSLTVVPGEHTITLRKKDFGTWQSKLPMAAGKRRVAAYLEQRTLTLE